MKQIFALASAFLALLVVEPAAASCAGPPPGFTDKTVDGSKVAFVGTVVRFRNDDDRWAIVRVDKTLKGRVANEVEVWGSVGRPQKNAASSIDRSYVLGGTYKFAFAEDRTPFQDSACSATEMIALVQIPEPGRPLPVAQPQGPSRSETTPIPWPAVGAGAAAILAGLVALGILDRRMNRASSPPADS